MLTAYFLSTLYMLPCLSQWPGGLRRRCVAVRISPVAWMYVSCDCCVLSGRGLCDELITRPEESYRAGFVFVCYLENLRRPWPTGGCLAKNKHAFMVWNGRSLLLLVDGKQEGFLCAWPYLATTGSTFPAIILYEVRNIICPSGFFRQTLPTFVLCHISPCSVHVLYCIP